MKRRKSAVAIASGPVNVKAEFPGDLTEGVIDLEADATTIEAAQGTGKTDVKLDPATGKHVGFTPSASLKAGDKVDTISQSIAIVEAVGTSAQAPARQKRKYTRRATKKAGSGASTIGVTPTFIDKDGIRNARIRAFIEYVDGNRTFDSATSYDDHLRKLLATADEISARLLTDAHAKATARINTLADKVEDGGYYRDDTATRSRADVEL